MGPWHKFYKFSLLKKLMYLRYHFLACTILAIVLFPFFNYYSLLVFISGFLIDLDHYLYDIFNSKIFDLFKAYKMHMNKERIIKDQLHIFHTLEFIILFLSLLIVSMNIYLIILGISFIIHLSLDYIYELYNIRNKIKLNQTRAYSLILWTLRNF
jgi:hypothetical protein